MPIITGGGNLSLTVQVCFNQDPNDPSPPTAVWSDITQRCSNITWSRGRQYELDRVEPGSFSATVNNDDGALTPGNFGSPFFPGVVLYRQIQVTAVYQSVTYQLFTGFVTQWPQAYNSAGQRPSTTLSAVDALGLMALVKLKGWGVDAYQLLGTSVLYPLNDAAGTTLFGCSIGALPSGRVITQPLAPAGVLAPGTSFDAGAPGLSGSTYTTFADAVSGLGSAAVILLPPNLLPSTGAWTLSFWFKVAAGAGSNMVMMNLVSDDQTAIITIYANAGATLQNLKMFGVHLGSSSYTVNYDSGVNVGDGAWHLVSLSLSSDQRTLRCIIDQGAAVTVLSEPTGPVISFAQMTTTTLGGTLTSGGFQGGMSNVAVWASDLASDATNPLQTVLYPAVRTGFASESTGARAKRIATVAGFGANFTSY